MRKMVQGNSFWGLEDGTESVCLCRRKQNKKDFQRDKRSLKKQKAAGGHGSRHWLNFSLGKKISDSSPEKEGKEEQV